MDWTNETDIKIFLTQHNFDIRRSRNARWIDQKCTPDVICIVADCILNFINTQENDLLFSSIDIWNHEYTVRNVGAIFSKPDTTSDFAKNEYNKFFQQPMELLAYAAILERHKLGNKNYYSISNKSLLNYIATRERNALIFLQEYIEKVLIDSEVFYLFTDFFQNQTQDEYTHLKNEFIRFTIQNTPINKEVECNRIFTKIINPLAFKRSARGTEKGRISRHRITFDVLMYNRDNFRDIYSDKPKNISRQQHETVIKSQPNPNYFTYMSQKAKRYLKEYNDKYRLGKSEVTEGLDINSPAIHVHHIFPEAQYPKISGHLENLIALTPTQHYVEAHPSGNTNIISKDYQYKCLLAKAHNIQENLTLNSTNTIYEFDKFIYVLNTGLNTNEFSNVDHLDFNTIILKLNDFY